MGDKRDPEDENMNKLLPPPYDPGDSTKRKSPLPNIISDGLSKHTEKDHKDKLLCHFYNVQNDDDTPLSETTDGVTLPKHLKYLYTGTIYASFMGFALCRSMYGPNLVELQLITSSSLDEISTVFTWLGAGGIAGSLTYGFLFDRCIQHPLIVFVMSLLSLGLVTTFIPWCHWFSVMMTLCGVQSFIFTGISVGCNVMIFRLWHSSASLPLLAMHVLYTVGGFISPILSQPFMVDSSDSKNLSNIMVAANYSINNRAISQSLQQMQELNSNVSHYFADRLYENLNPDIEIATESHSSSSAISLSSEDIVEETTRIHYAYLIVGLYLLVVATLNIFVFTQVNKYKQASEPPKPKTLFPKRKNNFKKYTSWCLFLLFNICFGGLETIYSGFLFTFASNHVFMSNSASSLLVAMLFVSYSAGRLAVIFTSQCISTHIILFFDLICGVVAGITLSYLTTTSIPALWGCTILQGLGSSTVFTTTLLWANEFLPITGRFTSTYVIAYTVGMMSWPALTGFLLQSYGSYWFPYITTMLTIGCVIWFSFLWMLRCTITPRRDIEEKEVRDDIIAASLQSLHAL